MNKFVKGFLNIGRHKLKYKERMMALLIESNGKLAIKQMEFKLESQKLELESHAQAQTIQLAITKMFKDTLHVFKEFKYL
jgi:hypothetical protein